MEWMHNWLINIVAVIFLGFITEAIMPEGSFKKSVELVVGLLIMLMIVKPITSFVISPEKLMAQINIAVPAANIDLEQQKKMGDLQRKQILNSWKNGLENSIKNKLSSQGIECSSLNVIVRPDYAGASTGIIEKISIQSNALTNDQISKMNRMLDQDYGITKDQIMISVQK